MANANVNDGLKYIGDGTQIGNAPTRDLTPEEVKKYGKTVLLQSGLYREIKIYSKPTKSAIKEANIAEE